MAHYITLYVFHQTDSGTPVVYKFALNLNVVPE